MSDPKRTDSLIDEFSRLPRTRASSRFAENVMTALGSRSATDLRPAGRVVWAGAVTLILAALLSVGYGLHRQRVADVAYQRQVEELRLRYQELLDEVANVRQEAASPETRLYLGGDDALDLVLDLDQDPGYAGSADGVMDIRPANLEQ